MPNEFQLDLTKGMSLDLTKDGNTLFKFNLSWNPEDIGEAIDVDASAFVLNLDSTTGTHKLTKIANAVYFKNPSCPTGAVTSPLGDSRDGKREGIDEQIVVDTIKLPADASQVNIYINIFKPRISFSKVHDCRVDIVDANDKPIANFRMSEQLTDENSLLVGAVTRTPAGWSFKTIGEAYIINDLNDIVTELNVKGSK